MHLNNFDYPTYYDFGNNSPNVKIIKLYFKSSLAHIHQIKHQNNLSEDDKRNSHCKIIFINLMSEHVHRQQTT